MDELAKAMATQLKENVPLKEIREKALSTGHTTEQINTALDKAHTLVQEDANRDPVLRLILGPALLIIAGVGFYTDWAGRSVGIGTVLSILLLLIGGRLVISLVKQWAKK
jgi:hypothetical protein